MKKIALITFIIFFSGFIKAINLFAVEAKKTLSLIPVKTVQIKQQAPAIQPPTLAPIKPAPVTENTYSYNPAGKPDPFRPFVEEEIAARKKAEKKKVLSIFPLQRMETEQFKLVGIAGNQKQRIAMVEDSTKKFYPLSVGTRIGVNNGKIIEILPDRIIVEEYIGKKIKIIILKLRKN
ncbi:MAG: pilus assembly protein PilP [Smithella sp.]